MPDGRGACEVAGKRGPRPFRAAPRLRKLGPFASGAGLVTSTRVALAT